MPASSPEANAVLMCSLSAFSPGTMLCIITFCSGRMASGSAILTVVLVRIGDAHKRTHRLVRAFALVALVDLREDALGPVRLPALGRVRELVADRAASPLAVAHDLRRAGGDLDVVQTAGTLTKGALEQGPGASGSDSAGIAGKEVSDFSSVKSQRRSGR